MIEHTPFRFPTQLQQSRLQHGWKQATLAEALGVKRRTVISWEAGERIPSVGVVVHLSSLLKTDLLTPYISDDLLRQYGESIPHELPLLPPDLAISLQKQGTSEAQESKQALPDCGEQPGASLTLLLPKDASLPQAKTTDPEPAPAWHDLFTLLDLLHAHPALIHVALDFLQEMVASQDRQAN